MTVTEPQGVFPGPDPGGSFLYRLAKQLDSELPARQLPRPNRWMSLADFFDKDKRLALCVASGDPGLAKSRLCDSVLSEADIIESSNNVLVLPRNLGTTGALFELDQAVLGGGRTSPDNNLSLKQLVRAFFFSATLPQEAQDLPFDVLDNLGHLSTLGLPLIDTAEKWSRIPRGLLLVPAEKFRSLLQTLARELAVALLQAENRLDFPLDLSLSSGEINRSLQQFSPKERQQISKTPLSGLVFLSELPASDEISLVESKTANHQRGLLLALPREHRQLAKVLTPELRQLMNDLTRQQWETIHNGLQSAHLEPGSSEKLGSRRNVNTIFMHPDNTKRLVTPRELREAIIDYLNKRGASELSSMLEQAEKEVFQLRNNPQVNGSSAQPFSRIKVRPWTDEEPLVVKGFRGEKVRGQDFVVYKGKPPEVGLGSESYSTVKVGERIVVAGESDPPALITIILRNDPDPFIVRPATAAEIASSLFNAGMKRVGPAVLPTTPAATTPAATTPALRSSKGPNLRRG